MSQKNIAKPKTQKAFERALEPARPASSHTRCMELQKLQLALPEFSRRLLDLERLFNALEVGYSEAAASGCQDEVTEALDAVGSLLRKAITNSYGVTHFIASRAAVEDSRQRLS